MKDSDTWAWKEGWINCDITVAPGGVEWIAPRIPSFNPEQDSIVLQARHNTVQGLNHFTIAANGKDLVTFDDKGVSKSYDANSGTYVDFRQDLKAGYDSYIYWERFLESLIFIDPIRHFERSSAVNMGCYFDGAAIIKELSSVQDLNRSGWLGFCESMEGWLGEIMNDKILAISIVNGDFRVKLKRGGRNINANLSELGTGVAQIVMLLAHLYLNKDKKFNVFLDEPESNLHPSSVVKLVKIFEKDLPEHSFFITTHSSVLIDQVNANWSVHRMYREADRASQVYPCLMPVHRFELLDDLGIRASQILQSNIVVWVEGPSDAIYLKKWIFDLSKGTLHCGEHYSFLFYGGSNLRSHTLLDDGVTDAVDLMCTSRYVAIFCDTDYSSDADSLAQKLKSRVIDIIDKLKLLTAYSTGRDGDINDFVKIWLTSGRETENYVPVEILKKVLANTKFRKHRFFRDVDGAITAVELKICPVKLNGLKFGRFDSFDVCFSCTYERVDGVPLTKKELTDIAGKYAGDKVAIAKAVVAEWESGDYNEPLSGEVNALITLIKKANGIIG